MEIKTKYTIGERVWIVEDRKESLQVYSDEISGITIQENGYWYYFKTTDIEITEDELIKYKDTDKLIKKIIKMDKEIEL